MNNIKSLVDNCHNYLWKNYLTSNTVSFNNAFIPSELVERLMFDMPHDVPTTAANDEAFKKAIQLTPQLTTLCLSKWTITGEALKALNGTFLTKIHLDHCYHLEAVDLIAFLKTTPYLSTLILENISLSHAELLEIISFCPHLEELKCCIKDDNGNILSFLEKNCPKLKKLSLHYLGKNNQAWNAGIPSLYLFKELYFLRIKGGVIDIPYTLALLPPSLMHLELSQCEHLPLSSNDFWKDSKIKTLVIERGNYKREMIENILQGCKQLTSLQITGAGIGKSIIFLISKAFKELKDLKLIFTTPVNLEEDFKFFSKAESLLKATFPTCSITLKAKKDYEGNDSSEPSNENFDEEIWTDTNEELAEFLQWKSTDAVSS